jgi:predicted O-methyltransferase YrrM
MSPLWKIAVATVGLLLLGAGLVLLMPPSPSPVAPSLVCPVLTGQANPAQAPYDREYDFHEDWFTLNIPVWSKLLAPFKDAPNLRYLEIGVWEGRSAIWMLENILTNESSAMTAVDLFPEINGRDIGKVFAANVKIAGATDRVEIRTGFSQEVMRTLPLEGFDVIYIDGSHDGADVLEDAVRATRLLKGGGLLIFDDYEWHWQRPEEALESRIKSAINTFVDYYGDQFTLIHCGYQLALTKKIKD